MRRAKIRPSINLAASRRSVAAAPASKPKETTTAPKPETTKPGLRSASNHANPPASQLAETQTQASQEKPVHKEQSQHDVQPKQQQQQQQQELQQQQQHDQDTEKQDQETGAGQAAVAEHQQESSPPSGKPTPGTPTTKPTHDDQVSPPKPVPSSQSKPAPESPTKSANVRRKRITAVPNLGQPRLRPGPNLATKPRPKLTPAKEKETATRGAGAVQEATEGQMGPPQPPPPVQRIISSTAPKTPVATKEPAKVAFKLASKPQDSQSKPQVPPTSQTNHAPAALTAPSRPILSRTDSVTEKHPVGAENIYEKKLRELKDRIDAETPSRRRRHYVTKNVQPPDRSKMTMSDLIYFNPKTSPMKNTAASKEKKFPRTIMTEHVVSANNSVNNSAHNSENEDDDEEKEEDVDPFAPQVKIGPDGSIILDSSSLIKDASPAKTLHLSDNDIIQEESSHTTYASFRKRTHTTAWSEKDTAKFYRALSAVGTDFTMINAMFPKRTRHQIKNKFKREERVNRQRLDKAIKERQHFDISLFNKVSSDSETENHGDQRGKGKKGKPKAQGPKGAKRGRGKAKGSGRTTKKGRKGDVDKDSDEESVNTEVGSKGDAPDIARDATLEEEGRDLKQEVPTRQSDGSDEEVSVEAILSQPTRSGRQPKFNKSFTVEEPEGRKRGPYRKNTMKGPSESLGMKKANTLAQKLQARDSFPPYTPGGLSRSPLSHPAQASTTQVRPASGSPLVRTIGGSRGMTSPGNRGISTITTPMGRFVVSVPQQPANCQGGASPRPIGAQASSQASSSSEGPRKAIRSHIFVISSPDGVQNIIQVPVQPDPSSSEADQQQSSDQTVHRPSGAPPPRPQNPMTTPRILRTASKNLPRNPVVIVREVPVQSPQQHVTLQQSHTSQVSAPLIPMPTPSSQRATGAKPTQSQQISRPRKREHPKPLEFLPPTGSNKVIIMSPHAQPQQVLGWTSPHASQPNSAAVHVSPAILAETTSPTVIIHNQNSSETSLQQVHQELVPSPVSGQHGETCVSHHSEFTPADSPTASVTYDPSQKVSHMTSDTNTDWLLRDEAVVHEVDIPTTDFIEEVAETDEPFIPPSNVGRSPLEMNESDQVIMGHVTEEHLTAQDILEQMTYEQGVGGDVGANLEVAINEEIITQIATEMTVE